MLRSPASTDRPQTHNLAYNVVRYPGFCRARSLANHSRLALSNSGTSFTDVERRYARFIIKANYNRYTKQDYLALPLLVLST